MGKRPRWLVPLLAVTLVLVAQAAQTETIRGLQAQIERKEGENQQAQSQLTQAQAVVKGHEADVRAAQMALQSRQSTRDEARTKYKEGQRWALENPEFSTERLRQNYREAQTAHEQAEQALEAAQQRLARATSQVTRLRATLDGYTDEIHTLKRRVADAQFERLRAEISQPKTVTARGEVGCSEMTVSACQTAALEQARRRAVEQGTTVLVKGVTVVEDFQLTRDDIRSQVRGLIVNQEVLDEGWVGRSSYYYEIKATVRGQVPDDWRPGVPSQSDTVGRGAECAPSFIGEAKYEACKDERGVQYRHWKDISCFRLEGGVRVDEPCSDLVGRGVKCPPRFIEGVRYAACDDRRGVQYRERRNFTCFRFIEGLGRVYELCDFFRSGETG